MYDEDHWKIKNSQFLSASEVSSETLRFTSEMSILTQCVLVLRTIWSTPSWPMGNRGCDSESWSNVYWGWRSANHLPGGRDPGKSGPSSGDQAPGEAVSRQAPGPRALRRRASKWDRATPEQMRDRRPRTQRRSRPGNSREGGGLTWVA